MSITISGSDGIDQSGTTGSTILPRGTTAQRPSSPVDGMMRYNTDINVVEFYDGNTDEWVSTDNRGVLATGGTVTDITDNGIGYRVHTFSSVGTSSFQVVRGGEVEYLVVAGGGAGGGNGGGGGAGGYRSSVVGENSGRNFLAAPKITLGAQNYSVVVGAGGSGGQYNNRAQHTDGQDSSFAGIVSAGGAVGGSEGITGDNGSGEGNNGGSGSGGGYQNNAGGFGISGQGFDGAASTEGSSGFYGGGGGSGSSPSTMDGGNGTASSIDGTSTTRAAGGGGGRQEASPAGIGGAGGAGDGGISNGTASSAVASTGSGGGGSAGEAAYQVTAAPASLSFGTKFNKVNI